MAFGVYKKGQGRAARGATGVVAVLVGAWAAHQMWFTLFQWSMPPRMVTAALVFIAFGLVPVYLVLFHHQVADLLIETQQEMRKVAWSTRAEVVASTLVVIVTVTLLALFIFATDRLLLWIAQVSGVY